MKENAYKLLAIIGLIIFVAVGLYLSEAGFMDLQSMRKLQRMPVSPIYGLVDGPVATEGKVVQLDKTLSAPYSHTKVVYYRYLKEEEYRDSEGNSKWRTVKNETRSLDFLLDDGPSDIVINTGEDFDKPVNWSLARDTYRTVGSYRYSEWYIRPGDSLFIVGMHHDEEIYFSRAGYYDPIVSEFGKEYELQEYGANSVFKMWGGMALVSLALVLLSWALGQHRILFFLSVQTLVITVLIGHYSLRMSAQDLKGGYNSYQTKFKVIDSDFSSVFSEYGYHYKGITDLVDFSPEKYPDIPEDVADRLRQIKYNLAVNQYRYRQQARQFPEIIMAPLLGLKIKDPQIMVLDNQAKLPVVRVSSMWKGVSASICFVLWMTLTWLAIRWIKVKRMIENLPTVKTTGLAIGLNELKGKVVEIEGVESMRSPLTRKDCVWYTYKVEEKRGSGKNSRWVTIEKDEDWQFFLCKDGDGVLTIDPHKAKILSRHKTVERRGDYRYTEAILRYGDNLYAMGDTRVADEETAEANVTALIMAEAKDQPFILSNHTEEDLMLREALKGMLAMSIAFSTLQLTAMLGMAANGYFAAHDLLFSALSCPLMFIMVMFILHYNDLIFLRNRAERNWKNIEVSLKKRSDLMKSLHTIVKKYMDHEQGLLEAVIKWRQLGQKAGKDAATASEFLQAEERAALEFRMVLENYPKLKASRLISQLMNTTTHLENEISLMRTAYNDSVEYYNTRIASFPDVLISKRCGFERRRLIRYDSIRDSSVSVKL